MRTRTVFSKLAHLSRAQLPQLRHRVVHERPKDGGDGEEERADGIRDNGHDTRDNDRR